MTKAKSIQMNKIMRMTEKRKQRIMNHYISMYPEELAYYFSISSEREQLLIVKALSTAPKNYREKVEYYSKHPIELKEALAKSGLERKTA